LTDSFWTLSRLGRKRCSNIYSSESSDPILSYLYQLGKNKTASIEELASVTNKPDFDTKSKLRKFQKEGLTESLGPV
jgi:hypothetical protein